MATFEQKDLRLQRLLEPGIAAGPDGNLWFTEYSGVRIGRITPTGIVTEFSAGITAGSEPQAIVAGPDGNLWFTEVSGHAIGRIVPTEPTLAPSAPPAAGAVSPASGDPGTPVTIIGANFDTAREVLFGAAPASFTVNGYGSITAVVPAGVSGTVPVTVVDGQGRSGASPPPTFNATGAAAAGATSDGTTTTVSPPALACARVPSLLRHTLLGALKILARDSCMVGLTHTGHAKKPPSHVRSQSVKPGTPLNAGDKLSVTLG